MFVTVVIITLNTCGATLFGHSKNGSLTIDFLLVFSEFEALNSQMDQLNSALDVLEEQNDIIHAKLMDLLESNREARKQFKEEQEKTALEKEEKK